AGGAPATARAAGLGAAAAPPRQARDPPPAPRADRGRIDPGANADTLRFRARACVRRAELARGLHQCPGPIGSVLMTDTVQSEDADKPCVVALHCSLGSGRQWSKLAAALGPDMQVIAPDLAGYGSNPVSSDLPTTLAQEVDGLRGSLEGAKGPIHLVAHSYGAALAFKIATASPFFSRIRSL